MQRIPASRYRRLLRAQRAGSHHPVHQPHRLFLYCEESPFATAQLGVDPIGLEHFSLYDGAGHGDNGNEGDEDDEEDDYHHKASSSDDGYENENDESGNESENDIKSAGKARQFIAFVRTQPNKEIRRNEVTVKEAARVLRIGNWNGVYTKSVKGFYKARVLKKVYVAKLAEQDPMRRVQKYKFVNERQLPSKGTCFYQGAAVLAETELAILYLHFCFYLDLQLP